MRWYEYEGSQSSRADIADLWFMENIYFGSLLCFWIANKPGGEIINEFLLHLICHNETKTLYMVNGRKRPMVFVWTGLDIQAKPYNETWSDQMINIIRNHKFHKCIFVTLDSLMRILFWYPRVRLWVSVGWFGCGGPWNCSEY